MYGVWEEIIIIGVLAMGDLLSSETPIAVSSETTNFHWRPPPPSFHWRSHDLYLRFQDFYWMPPNLYLRTGGARVENI